MKRLKPTLGMLSIAHRLCLIGLLLICGTQLAHAERKATYYHTDGLGSVVAASDQAGALLWRKEYAPFGAQTDSTAENEKIAFTGKEHDDVTGLTYFGARYYDPYLGRFTSVDPVGFVESNPMSFNRYAYVNNNPYKYVDPDGEFLNFAAKFVLDVGINVAFNYVTTGKMDVGGALKESAVGILNPAKTLTKAGKLARALSATKKIAPDASVSSKLSLVSKQDSLDADTLIYRQGTSKESVTRLNRKAQEAENSNIKIHGVSGSTTPSPGCSVATCSALEAEGFKVHKTATRADPNHVTIELPKPVSSSDAARFNKTFGRD